MIFLLVLAYINCKSWSMGVNLDWDIIAWHSLLLGKWVLHCANSVRCEFKFQKFARKTVRDDNLYRTVFKVDGKDNFQVMTSDDQSENVFGLPPTVLCNQYSVIPGRSVGFVPLSSPPLPFLPGVFPCISPIKNVWFAPGSQGTVSLKAIANIKGTRVTVGKEGYCLRFSLLTAYTVT